MKTNTELNNKITELSVINLKPNDYIVCTYKEHSLTQDQRYNLQKLLSKMEVQ